MIILEVKEKKFTINQNKHDKTKKSILKSKIYGKTGKSRGKAETLSSKTEACNGKTDKT